MLASRYRLDRPIASGGMGSVWRARDVRLGRPVAVKLLHERIAADPRAVHRFRREALAAAAVDHPGLAAVLDFVEEDGRAVLVMELVEGESLAAVLAREGPLAPARAVAIADALLDGVEAAHRAGIVHRDVKPSNVLLARDGSVKLTDFGIARIDGEETVTHDGAVFASAPYVAPEQLSGDAATPATDVYAVGVLLYEMLCGRRPFEGETPAAVAMARLAAEPVPLTQRWPGAPRALVSVVHRALRRDPSRRWPSAAAMRGALRGAGCTGRAARPLAPLEAPGGATRAFGNGEVATRHLSRHGSAAPPPARRFPRRRGRARAPRARRPLRPALFVPLVIALALATGLPLLGSAATVRVPELTGLALDDARAIVADAGLGISVREVASGEPAGTVVSQDVPPGIEIRRGTVVSVSVSSGPPEVEEEPGGPPEAADGERGDEAGDAGGAGGGGPKHERGKGRGSEKRDG